MKHVVTATRAVLAIAFLTGIAACGSDDAASPPRDVSLEMFEFGFRSDDVISIAVGDTIRFNVSNAGTIVHQMEVLNEANTRLGMTERLAAGTNETVTVSFDEPGVYTVICDIDDHRANGQVAQFTVAEPTEQ